MIVRGPRLAENFTILPNDALRDRRLSFRARGVMAFILSQPPDFAISSEELAECSGAEGRDAIRTALKELETASYLHRRRRQIEGGRWISEAVLYEQPTTGNPSSVSPGETRISAGRTDDGSTDVGQPVAKNEELALEGLEEGLTTAPAAPTPTATVTEIRPRDLVWDAVMAACAIDSTSITKSARGAYNRAVGDLRSIEASPEEIHLRAQRHLALWPHVSLTPNSLARHWAELSEDPRRVPAMSHATNAAQQWLAMGDGR